MGTPQKQKSPKKSEESPKLQTSSKKESLKSEKITPASARKSSTPTTTPPVKKGIKRRSAITPPSSKAKKVKLSPKQSPTGPKLNLAANYIQKTSAKTPLAKKVGNKEASKFYGPNAAKTPKGALNLPKTPASKKSKKPDPVKTPLAKKS